MNAPAVLGNTVRRLHEHSHRQADALLIHVRLHEHSHRQADALLIHVYHFLKVVGINKKIKQYKRGSEMHNYVNL